MKHIYTIKKSDIGKRFVNVNCPCCNTAKIYDLQIVLGKVLYKDIGKRIYITDKKTLKIENNEQLQKRLSNHI